MQMHMKPIGQEYLNTMNMTDKEIIQIILDNGYLIVMNDQNAYEITDDTGTLEPREALVDSLTTFLTSKINSQPA